MLRYRLPSSPATTASKGKLSHLNSGQNQVSVYCSMGDRVVRQFDPVAVTYRLYVVTRLPRSHHLTIAVDLVQQCFKQSETTE